MMPLSSLHSHIDFGQLADSLQVLRHQSSSMPSPASLVATHPIGSPCGARADWPSSAASARAAALAAEAAVAAAASVAAAAASLAATAAAVTAIASAALAAASSAAVMGASILVCVAAGVAAFARNLFLIKPSSLIGMSGSLGS